MLIKYINLSQEQVYSFVYRRQSVLHFYSFYLCFITLFSLKFIDILHLHPYAVLIFLLSVSAYSLYTNSFDFYLNAFFCNCYI